MPLGILSDEEFEKELNSYKDNDKTKSINEHDKDCALIKDIPTQGRNEGDTNKPESLRQVIAQCKIEGSDDAEIKEAFKTSTSAINAYTNGKNGTSDKVNERLAKFVTAARSTITKKASRKLISALDHITEDKISELKANEISVVAKNLSSIINENEHKNAQIGNLNAQFVIFAPPQKAINDYDVIDVGN
jgi:hypothetical protein